MFNDILFAFGYFIVIAWNIFGLIGLVVTIKFIVHKLSQPNKQKVVKSIPINTTREAEIKPSAISVHVDDVKVNDNHPKTSNVTALLYLGSTLVIFALFVFIAFTWSWYTPFFKLLMISLATIAFYLAGVLFYRTAKFKDAGVTFLVIGSASLALSGFGFWNFFFKLNGLITFWEHWLLHSLVMVFVYFIILRFAKIKSFLYVLLFAVYSTFLSVSMAYFDASYSRLSIFLLLNLVLYIGISEFLPGFKRRVITGMITMVQYAFAGVLLLVLSFNIGLADHVGLIFSGVLLLFSTLVFAMQAKLYKDEFADIFIMIEALLFLPKLILLVLLINSNVNENTLLVVSLLTYFVGYALLLAKSKNISGLSITRNTSLYKWFILLFVSAVFSIFYSMFNFMSGNMTYIGHQAVLTIFLLFSSIVHFSYARKLKMIHYLSIPLGLLLVSGLNSSLINEFHFTILGDAFFGISFGVLAYFTFLESIEWYKNHHEFHPSLAGFIIYSFFSVTSLSSLPSSQSLPFLIAALLLLVASVYYANLSRRKEFVISSVYTLFFLAFPILSFWKGYVSQISWKIYPYYLYLLVTIFGILLLSLRNISSSDRLFKLIKSNFSLIRKNVFAVFYFSLFLTYATSFRIVSDDIFLLLLGSWLLIVIGLYSSGGSKNFKYSVGIPIVLSIWLTITKYELFDLSSLAYTIPLSAYFYYLSEMTRNNSLYKVTTYRIWLMLSYISLAFVMLVNSIGMEPETTRISYGIGLIIISSILIYFNINRKSKTFVYVPFGFIIFELIVLFMDVILSIPWWIYIGLIGLSIIGVAIWKTSKDKSTDLPPNKTG